jgi:hypothetical protein
MRMEKEDFNQKVNILMMELETTTLTISSKSQKLVQKQKLLKQIIQQKVDSTKYEQNLVEVKTKIQKLENIEKQLGVIRKSLSQNYVHAQGLMNIGLEEEQLSKELDNIGLNTYLNQIKELQGEIDA